MLKTIRLWCVAVILSLAVRGAAAGPIQLVFDELPFQPIDGLTFSGVAFDFKIADSSDAFYNSFGPGNLNSVHDPSLTGNSAGVLTLDFLLPTTLLEFGASLNTASALSPGYTVELFDASFASLGVTPVNTAVEVPLGFSEGTFSYSGPPIARAVIDFADAPGSFALDNLRYNPVPEPPTVILAAVAGLLALWSGRGRCRRQRCLRIWTTCLRRRPSAAGPGEAEADENGFHAGPQDAAAAQVVDQ